MQRICVFVCLSVGLTLSSAMGGQTQKATSSKAPVVKQAMTNSDVVKMVKAGITSDTILLAMEHRKTNFDTSADALILLTQNGVSKNVIDAMLTGSNKPGVPSSSHSSATSKATTQNLSDGFAIAGLKALNAIQGETERLGFQGSSVIVPRATNQLIANADAEARVAEEKAMVGLLNKAFLLRLAINLQIEVVMVGFYGPDAEEKGHAKADADASIMDNRARLSACSNALEPVLRNRNLVAIPNECNDLRPNMSGQ